MSLRIGALGAAFLRSGRSSGFEGRFDVWVGRLRPELRQA